VGGGDAAPWRAHARELGCESTVVFAGRVEDPGPFYKQASVFVLPSRQEGLSNALLEAQSWGVPAVVSDIPGNRAVVRDGENGVVVPVGDESALAAALLRLLGEPSSRAAMGRSGRAQMEKSFAMDKVIQHLEDTYQAIQRRAV
jgi:glycosyltransferase involved in cell wall biosynthesis